MELSRIQQQAVETMGKNICVSAGAGSGKTRVLVERFLHLVMHQGVSPQSILAVTFTEKAANEMKRRIVERLRAQGLDEARREIENAWIGTIHAFAARVLREHPVEAGVDPFFAILEPAEAESLQEESLDRAIEALVIEAAAFDLLKRFGEKKVREGIMEAFRVSRNTGIPFEELLRNRTAVTRDVLQLQLKDALHRIRDVNGASEVLRQVDTLFRKETFQVEDAEWVAELRKELRAVGKQKEAIREAQTLLSDLAGFIREEATLPVRDVFIRLALDFEKAYEAAKQEAAAVDFDDLQLRAVQVLGSDRPISKALRKRYQERFEAVLVDEFQDTNPLQDRLVDWVRRDSNLFIVGDFKQSIYGFRGTQVEIFLEKEKMLAAGATGLRISMCENYRSRPRLIQVVNRFFERLWQEDAIPFEPLEALREEKSQGPCVERLVLERGEAESLDDVRIREARSLAARIESLLAEGYECRDIAFLFEAMTHVHFYEQEFRRRGLPYYVVSNRGFYSQPEIRDVVSFLTMLENPRRDIPLAAALRSPLFQASDETLFWLARRAKTTEKGTPLVTAVLEFESIPEITEGEKAKLRFFKGTFDEMLKEKEKCLLSELIERLLRVTAFDLYVLKLRQGERRLANLKKLVEIAREMETRGGTRRALTLGDFVRMVKGLETREIRQSQAQVESEEGNVVRLLSIHMAKGLEFPVVILPDLGRGEKSVAQRFLVSEEDGLGLEGSLTFTRNRARLARRRSEESKRLLYVAMTRAREKLMLSGPKMEDSDKESFHEMATWAHWVGQILGEGEWEVTRLEEAPREPFPYERRKALADRRGIRRHLENLSRIPLRREPPQIETLWQNLSVPRPVCFRRIDLPVSAFLLFGKDPESYFRRYEIGAPETNGGRPLEAKEEEVSEEEELTSAEFGTRIHLILEQVVARRLGPREAVALAKRHSEDLGEKEQSEILSIVHRFVSSDDAREILKAKQRYPELPFVLRLRHGLVHGKMDLIYESGGDWMILDYKTSQVSLETFRQKGEDYRLQMELYALATYQILGKPPREARILFLRGGFTYPILLAEEDFSGLYEKFSGVQEKILEFRQAKIEAALA